MRSSVLGGRRAAIVRLVSQRRVEPARSGLTVAADGAIGTDRLDADADAEAVTLFVERRFDQARGDLGELVGEHGVTSDDSDS
jgi:hypothetical protein